MAGRREIDEQNLETRPGSKSTYIVQSQRSIYLTSYQLCRQLFDPDRRQKYKRRVEARVHRRLILIGRCSQAAGFQL